MMDIPGFIFILVGAAVSLVSYFSELSIIFVIVGAGFILWGIIKLIIAKINAKAKEQIPAEIQPQHIKKEQNPVHMHPTVIACPSCGLKHYSHANYCQHCGTRIKK